MEYLDAGAPERPKRKARPWAPIIGGVVTFLVVLFAVGTVTVDWVDRNLEMRQLVSQIEVSEQAMAGTQVDLANAIEAFRAKTTPTDADRAELGDRAQGSGGEGPDGGHQGR